MGFFRLAVVFVVLTNYVLCRHLHHGFHVEDQNLTEHAKRYAKDEENVVLTEGEKSKKIGEKKGSIPFSERRLEKMLEKAILKIITGELSTGDMKLLKSLNYTLEEVMAIRERELRTKEDEEWRKIRSRKNKYHSSRKDSEDNKGKKNRHTEKPLYKDIDLEAYNRQAVLDYENLPPNAEFKQPLSESLDYEDTTIDSKEEDANDLRRNFDKAMEPHVVFKIRYDDSEFDSSSGSEEGNNNRTDKHHAIRHTTKPGNANDSFHETFTQSSSNFSTLPLVHQLSSSKVGSNYASDNYSTTIETFSSTAEDTTVEEVSKDENGTMVTEMNNSTEVTKSEEKSGENGKVNEYEGLEWVGDDVYRVIPQFVDSLGFENTDENETSDYEDSNSRSSWLAENDTSEYQNDDSVKFNASTNNLPLGNLSTYMQLAINHRRRGNVSSNFDSQGEKAIEDIKSRVLALTGRFNLSTNTNQVQRERLTMFSPTCQIPRNTDQESWTDPFSMNMHFQLNLTSEDHVVAAKLRLFKLPQENLTSSSESLLDEEEDDEKKIRISVYYYTKSLKRHRSKKRLMDSVVTPLTSKGTHLALDVRQGLRFWRLNTRNAHGNGNNHGLVVQVEDQDGRPLKPALYIQQPSCAEEDSDQKTSEYLHSSYEPVLVTFAS